MSRSANDPMSYMNVDAFFYHHIQQTYGLDQLAHKYCELYLTSTMFHKNVKNEALKDQRIDLFARFVGVAHDRLPYSIFEKYMYMIKGTSMNINNLFQVNLNNTFVDYMKVRYVFKELISTASELIHKSVYTSLKSAVKSTAVNMYIAKTIEIEEFEVFKDLLD